MTETDKPHDGYGFARPGSRLESVMRQRGSYVPQSLIQDFEEALRLICIQEGAQEGELRDIVITPSKPYGNFPYSLEIQHRGFNKPTPAPLIPLCEQLEAYAKGRSGVQVDDGGPYTRISGNNFRDMLHVLNEGFVKLHDPEANIDVDGKMDASWVERSKSDGQGAGPTVPGG